MSNGAWNAYLGFIQTHDLTLRRCAKVESRDQINRLCDRGSYNKSITTACGDECDLLIQLLPVLVDESSWDPDINAVHSDNRSRSEECIHEKSDDAANSVLGEKIKSIIDTDQVFHFKQRMSGNCVQRL